MDPIKNLLENCAGFKAGEKCIIVSDLSSRSAAREIARESGAGIVEIENLSRRPVKKMPSALSKAIKDADITFFVAKSMEAEDAFRTELRREALRSGRYIFMPDTTAATLKESLQYDYKKIDAMTKMLHNMMKSAKKIRINNEKTKLNIELKEPKWTPDSGICHKKSRWISMPAGELALQNFIMKGTAAVSIMGGIFAKKYGMINDLVIEVKDNAITSITGDKRAANSLTEYIKSDSSKITSIFFGTNQFIEKPSGLFALDKKMPSVSIRIGRKPGLDLLVTDVSIDIVEPINFSVLKNRKYLV